jgi:hypothetical protein
VHSLEAALWVFAHTDSFSEAILMAANLGDDADTTAGYNFCWLHPRKSVHCHVQVRPGNENRDEVIKQLEEAGIATAHTSETP